ncbi:MAG: glycosyltransferase family 39 protein [Patescibacteria group bacterium]|nr:glycosyltransferase family 39 protein [Patescibacteria group bacterium]MCL5431559.1 glycosyltransferase family 39 protein [Patescibacteria group bacterium]
MVSKDKILLVVVVFLAFVLRFYQLGSNPPSLYWDEASLGYNAFSIATTLRDEHGEFLPLTRFIAFGDYKAPGYIYAAAAAVKLFGLSELTVRLSSALAGTLLVLVTYFLVKELINDKQIALISSFLVAISPWSLQLSRGAFEANLATLFSTAGVWFFLIALRRKSAISYQLSAISFILSMYTFNSHRIFVPLMIGALLLIFSRRLWMQKKHVGLFLVSCFLFLVPLLLYARTREAQLRFNEVSWLNDSAPIELSNQRIAYDHDVWWAKIIHNRRVVYSLEFLKHYTDAFSTDFLFIKGDVNERLSIQTMGELYLIDLPFLLAGLYLLVRRPNKSTAVILAWALLAPIPAAMARETPHALRTLNLLPIPQIITAIGVAWSIKKFPKFLIPLTLLISLSVLFYLHSYYIDYPKKYDLAWQYGYKQLVSYVAAHENNYDHISVTETYGRPYIYFLFYEQYPLEKYLQTVSTDRDWYGFWYVHGFDKLVFGDTAPGQGSTLFVRGPDEAPAGAKLVDTIDDLNHKPVFLLWASR